MPLSVRVGHGIADIITGLLPECGLAAWYIDLAVAVLVLVFVLVIAISLWSAITLKQDMRYMCEELIATATSTGKVGEEVEQRFAELCEQTGITPTVTRNTTYYGHGIKIQKQLKYFDFEIGDPDLFGYAVKLSENMLCFVRAVKHTRTVAQGKTGNNGFGYGGEISYLFGQGSFDNIEINGNRQPVIMAGRKCKSSRVPTPQIKLHVSGSRVAHKTVLGYVFHASFAAMIDREKPPVGDVCAVNVFHMKIIEAERDARKYIVSRHGSVAGFVAELTDGTAVTLCKQKSAPVFGCFRVVHMLSPLFCPMIDFFVRELTYVNCNSKYSIKNIVCLYRSDKKTPIGYFLSEKAQNR